MANNSTSLEQLKGFLNQLFQFDTQDLDFGVYKILHYKRKEIKDFIENLLGDKVKEQLQTLSDDEAKQIQEQLSELQKDSIVDGWLKADEAEKKTLEKWGKDKINQYLDLKTKSTEAKVSVETVNQIYNHLTLFFSRYYDKGDFISKRRFGKNEKYMVPYNGEETHFHWANQDQYYIKSSETFQSYAFKIRGIQDDVIINFKLTEARVEQGNVKGDEPNYFILSEQEAIVRENVATFFFEYRPLTEDEKKTIKGNNKQDILDEEAFNLIKATHARNANLAELWKVDSEERVLLLKKLHHYTRKNKYDFFIHKNLKGFLERELDFYIKSELINVNDLYVTDAESHFNRLKHNLKTIKVFKSIADTIIDFVSQIEEFQKKLWEKKKFVLSTEWVITIDRLVEYIDEEAAKQILEEVIKNEKQIAEWKELFGKENVPSILTIDTLKADLHNWRKLPIDTVHFPEKFKFNLLNKLSEKINLDELSNGTIIHSDNYHGLAILQDKYVGSISPIYIDPPYNTDASAILYKNNYKSSSFLSLMDQRIRLSENLLKDDSMICVAIDDVEVIGLRKILSEYYFKEVGIVAVRSNPAGRKTRGKFSPAHEYALFYGKTAQSIPRSLEITEKRIERYPEKDEQGNFAWANFIRSGTGDKREDRPTMYYPIYVNKDNKIRIPEMDWDSENEEYIILEDPMPDEDVVYPIIKDGEMEIEKRWQRGFERVKSELEEYRIRRVTKDKISIDFKTRMDENSLPITWWDDKLYASANYGAAELKELFNIKPFDFPKAKTLVRDCIRVGGAGEPNSITLDFFPGSGTTFHAVQTFNQEDNGKRKCILVEQGNYVYSIIIPRIKKIGYSYEWKSGRPKNNIMNGLGVFFNYHRLEQYEESLENIAFSASEDALQKALAFDQYIPKYFLEFETRGSQTLVNTAAMQDPWNYKLKVWDGFTYDTEKAVDLVETFNYLIGLHMQKCITKEIEGKKYQFIIGHNNANKQIAVVWRSVKDWTLEDYKIDSEILKTELAAFSYDLLYINHQAHFEGYQPIEEVFKNKMLS